MNLPQIGEIRQVLDNARGTDRHGWKFIVKDVQKHAAIPTGKYALHDGFYIIENLITVLWQNGECNYPDHDWVRDCTKVVNG